MPDAEANANLELTTVSVAKPEYNAESSVRHRRSSSRSSSARRLLFFSLSATWGFMAGAGGLLAAMTAVGEDAHLTSWAIVGLAPALALAVAGGWVIAAAYKEAKHRARR